MTQQKSNTNNAVVIGGGFSGLATAALLGHSGWKVTLIEKNLQLGGRARVLKKKGFTFDMGPSWYLMPEVFDEFFKIFGKESSDYYKLVRLNPRYKVFFGDGQSFTLTDSIAENSHLFDQIEPGAGKKITEFLTRMERVYNLSTKKLMSADLWDINTWVDSSNISSIAKLTATLRFWDRWNNESKRFFKNEKLQQIIGFPAVFLGGSPFNTPALYSILTWADFGLGVWYPMGGMGKIVEALASIAKENGVEILTGEAVTQIAVNSGNVGGVKTDRRYLPADIVVGSSDLPHIQSALLPHNYQDWDNKYWSKKTLGISALLLYLGVNQKVPQVTHHNIYFSKDWEQNFKEIFDKNILPKDPSIYISVRSATDPAIVPKDMEEIFVLVPLGSGIKYKSDALSSYVDQVIAQVSTVLNFDIKKHLVVKEIFTPKDFTKSYNAFKGTALGLAHTLDQSLWFRPGNKSRKVKGLYYTGQYTQPGVGVPMALISAQITKKIIDKDHV